MILRGILNITTAIFGDETPVFISVNIPNNYSALIFEGIPVIILCNFFIYTFIYVTLINNIF